MNFKLPIIQRLDAGDIEFQSRKDSTSWWLYGFIFFIGIFFIILLLRLFQLTVVKGAFYSKAAEVNRIKEVVIEAPRGTLVDRKGIIMAENDDPLVHSDNERITSRRMYYEPEAIAHLVGYRQLADKNDFDHDTCDHKLSLGDKVGKKGIEKLYDCELRGFNGVKRIEINAHGKELRTVDVVQPRPGKTLQLAVDFELQKTIYNLLKDKKAAAIVMKPSTGEVLSLVSTPSFNIQQFEDSSQSMKDYFTDKDRPMFDRVSEGTYPPGSTFKIVLAAGALESKLIDAKTTYEDTGTIKAGDATFGNWYFLEYGKKEGSVDIVKALQRSNDIYFYHVGDKLGPEGIKNWAGIFGYGKATNIGLDESAGLLPSPFWKEDQLKEQWFLGDTYNYSIGQGYLLATPLQVAQATNIIANNGYLCQPQLLKLTAFQHGSCKKIPLSKTTHDLIVEGMTKACATGGTGWPLFDFSVKDGSTNRKVSVACKTGTAESQSKESDPHAWITAFAPAEKPEISVTVLIENGGQGSDIAGPIARDIFKAYFERQQ